MSCEIGMRIMNLEPTERVGRTEYCAHNELVRKITGLDPAAKDRKEQEKAWDKFYRWADYDFLWFADDGPDAWQKLGRATDMGHAVYAEGGTDFRDTLICPFKTPEEALSFDAAGEYGLPDVNERARYFQEVHQKMKAAYPELVNPGGYYKTLVSGCIETFGWDIFLMAVGTDQEKFGEYVLEGFFNVTLANIRAWAKTGVKVFVSHDDMVWTKGAIFKPEWYRKYIFPRYKKLWQPLKEAGIKVLFCSDGNFTEFIDDVAAAGADGFIFEPTTDLQRIASKYGKTHVIVGNADCRALTFGTKEDIEKEVKRCMDTAKACPGFIMAVGNHIPPNIPLDNALHYFDLVRKYGKR